MSFAAELKSFRSKTIAKQNAVVKEIVGQLSLSLIIKSPVGDPSLWKSGKAPAGYEGGQFRANWQYGLGEINKVTSNAIDADGGNTLDRIYSQIPDEAGGKVHFITNSLPYAIPLENGHSTQAPVGMVTLTAIEFAQIVPAAINTINGRSFGDAGELGA